MISRPLLHSFSGEGVTFCQFRLPRSQSGNPTDFANPAEILRQVGLCGKRQPSCKAKQAKG
jgi:hypothetical protein